MLQVPVDNYITRDVERSIVREVKVPIEVKKEVLVRQEVEVPVERIVERIRKVPVERTITKVIEKVCHCPVAFFLDSARIPHFFS